MNSPSPAAAVARLAARVLGPEIAASFHFETIPAAASGRDAFELEHEGGRVVVRGTSGPALAKGLNTYLNHAGGDVSWYGSQLGRVGKLPPLPAPVRRESWAKWRYFLNYCTFSYSLAYWKWEQWETLIDWMALRGMNMPLAVTGQEAVWQKVCGRLGMTDRETKEFLPGAAYLPFGWMGCLDGWTGPLSDAWIADHEALGRRILERQRELGMQPVLQGFTGHVPAAVRRNYPDAKMHAIHWFKWETHLVDPLDPLFATMAKLYCEEQSRTFGTDHLYAADTFIEMTPPSGDLGYLRDLGRAIYQGMAANDPQAVWLLQGWTFINQAKFWTAPRIEALFSEVPQDKILLLDLHCEAIPVWEKTNAFCGKPWLWCNVFNFGRTAILNGTYEVANVELQRVRRDPRATQLAGIGMANEGLCYNPPAYDFFFEQAWNEAPVDLAAWGREYAARRYGQAHPAAGEAWQRIVSEICRDYFSEVPGLAGCPTFPAKARPRETREAVGQVWKLLLDAAPELGGLEAYRFDLIHVGRQFLADLGMAWKQEMQDAVAAKDAAAFARVAAQLRGLFTDLAALLAGHPEFRLGTWVASAEAWGRDPEEQALLRRGALRQLTLWADGSEPPDIYGVILRDYAHKEWAGLVSEFYLPRWEAWFAFAGKALAAGEAPDEAAYRQESIVWERRWIEEGQVADPAPGDPVAVGGALHAKYAGAAR